jgi:hypothetical protein
MHMSSLFAAALYDLFFFFNRILENSFIALKMNIFACCSHRMHDSEGRDHFAESMQISPDRHSQNVSKLCGLGIAFKPDKKGNLFVKRLVPGGPAASSKEIQAHMHTYMYVYICIYSNLILVIEVRGSQCMIEHESTSALKIVCIWGRGRVGACVRGV